MKWALWMTGTRRLQGLHERQELHELHERQLLLGRWQCVQHQANVGPERSW